MNSFFGNFFLWFIYTPILFTLKILLFFVPKVQERLRFEKLNSLEVGAKSFKVQGITADLCFEFSSEGEYQQVAGLVDDALKMGKKIELVFFSPSVEKTIVELYKKYPEQIRYFRYPILSVSFSSWISSQTLVLVRYDLFPEFLIWSLGKGRTLKFVWVSFKKERLSQKGVSLFKKAFLNQASVIVYSSEAEEKLGKSLGFKGVTYDFRMEQIKRRLEKREEKFSLIFPEYQELKNKFELYPRQKRLILGNAWPIDLDLLQGLPSDIYVLIVPHKLDQDIISQMKTKISNSGLTSVTLLEKKGVLCELYADFGKAYVGGGFGVSVHSLLEPLVSGSDHLSVGPIHQRSTEFDLAHEYGELKEVRNSQEFQKWLLEVIPERREHAKLKTQIALYPEFRKDILSC